MNNKDEEKKIISIKPKKILVKKSKRHIFESMDISIDALKLPDKKDEDNRSSDKVN